MPTLRVRRMTSDDIGHGMALKQQAGWNQIEADWRRLLDLQPEGGFIAESDGLPVGTVLTCRFGPVAWVAMMLVESSHRGRGIGRSLMTRALGFLDGSGVRSVRLDATPLGRPLYESLGFVPEATIVRHLGRPAETGPHDPLPGARLDADWDDGIPACDRRASGTDRRPLLARLFEENPGSLRVARADGSVSGFVLARPGSAATQIGPCIADGDAGRVLLADALRRHSGREVIVGVPEGHRAARALVESSGLAVARHLVRMTRGPRVAERLDRIWATSGPEMG